MTKLEEIERWLDQEGLTDDPDPHIMLLRAAAEELDDLADLRLDLTPVQVLAARQKARTTLAAARKAMQPVIDAASSRSSQARYQVTYGRIAAQALGFVDLGLLSADLRAAVLDYLHTVHDIDVTEYQPRRLPT